MARALFLGLPLHGHTNPSLPLVRALVERGEEIVYYSCPSFAERIVEAGAHYRPYRTPFLAEMPALSDRTHELAWLLMRTTAEVLEQELADFRQEQPTYVIADSVAPWGQWVGQVLRLPVVTSITTFAVNRHVLAFGAKSGARPKSARLVFSKLQHVAKAALLRRRLRRQHGVAGTTIMGLMYGRSDLNVVYTSAYFQPRAETFDPSFRFVGPSIASRRESMSAAGSAAWASESSSPLVYISLGTLFNANATFYRHCFQAFSGEDVRVLMAIGKSVDPASLGPPPANVVVQPYVQQLEVLQRASAFVSHGGMNSVSESLHYGVPLVVVPQMGEQDIVGRRVEVLGAGLRIAREDVTPERLKEATRRILVEEKFREGAALVQRSFRDAGGVDEASDAILAFTRSRPA